MDELWRELYAIERRRWPRMEARFGQCPVCGLPASEVYRFATVAWGTCNLCKERWPAGEHLLEKLTSNQAARFHFEELSTFNQTETETPMKKSAAEESTVQQHGVAEAGVLAQSSGSETGTKFDPFTTEDGRRGVLENAALRIAARERAQVEGQLGCVHMTITAADRQEWARVLASEDPDQRARREKLAERFGQYWPFWVFPLGAEVLSAYEACDRVRAGADFTTYYRLLARCVSRRPADFRVDQG